MGLMQGWNSKPCTEFPWGISHDVELIEMRTTSAALEHI
jgi:hypothetical protein